MAHRSLAVLLVLALATTGCLNSVSSDAQDLLSPQRSDNATTGNGTAANDTGPDPSQAPSDDQNQTRDPDDNGTPDNDTAPQDPKEAPDENTSSPGWPSLEEATIRPGVRVTSKSGQCTSNFLFRSPHNATLYLGVAAHCVADGAQDNVNGCDKANKPMTPGAEVTIAGADRSGILVYSSWHAMQALGEENGGACMGNDFALIRIDQADRHKVHPAMRHFGGPTGLASPGDVGTLDKVLSYGNSGMRAGIEQSNWHEGYVLDSSKWTVNAYTAPPGVFGDSGSGVLTADGQALGVLSTLQVYPRAGANGISALESALAYAAGFGLTVELVTWEQLDRGLLP